MSASYLSALCWFRRDLRINDHAALFHALKSSKAVHCVFVFDTDLLDALPDRHDRRVEFIWLSVKELSSELQKLGATLHILHGSAAEEIPRLAKQLAVEAVYCNRDYEPQARKRDARVQQQLASERIAFHDCKDQVIFDQEEILTRAGKPFSVFTPYKHAWLKKLNAFQLRAYPVEQYWGKLAQHAPIAVPDLSDLGFLPTNLQEMNLPAGMSGASRLWTDFLRRIDCYHEWRDYPAVKGCSYLSVHLRFGTISIRTLAAECIRRGGKGAETFLSELIWRDFYQMILYHHPQLAEGRSYKPQFEAVPFENSERKFEAWCNAQTGYPLIDAAMRQLNQTGYMHNRLRMIVASFLVKDLHVDWRWGERYFARRLIDFDLASNNGGWQWAASTGCDAQPWFRIFNPVTQSEKFDPEGKFILRYLPELSELPVRYIHAPWMLPAEVRQKLGIQFPDPVVDHAVARAQALAIYKSVSVTSSSSLSFASQV